MKKFNLTAVGGTFDRLHIGHKELLQTAFLLSEKIIIGITSDQMVKGKKLPHLILSFKKRKKEVEEYLLVKKFAKRAEIVKLHDPYGPLLKDKNIQAVAVGPRADQNVLQNLKGKIKIIHCRTIRSEDNRYLSSTRIRKGEVSRDGRVYLKKENDLVLPEFLRERLKTPFGRLTKRQISKLNGGRPFVVSVGDGSTFFLNKNSVDIDLAIVDFKIKRKKVFNSFEELGFAKDFQKTHNICEAVNKPGTISLSLTSQIKKSFERLLKNKKRQIIKIDGEDDLAVLPAVLSAPLSSLVFYGQPNKGLVKVVVTEKKKEETAKIMSKFKVNSALNPTG